MNNLNCISLLLIIILYLTLNKSTKNIIGGKKNFDDEIKENKVSYNKNWYYFIYIMMILSGICILIVLYKLFKENVEHSEINNSQPLINNSQSSTNNLEPFTNNLEPFTNSLKPEINNSELSINNSEKLQNTIDKLKNEFKLNK